MVWRFIKRFKRQQAFLSISKWKIHPKKEDETKYRPHETRNAGYCRCKRAQQQEENEEEKDEVCGVESHQFQSSAVRASVTESRSQLSRLGLEEASSALTGKKKNMQKASPNNSLLCFLHFDLKPWCGLSFSFQNRFYSIALQVPSVCELH